MIAYNINYDPPAPIFTATVANVLNRRLRQTLPALLDTGADVTAIPDILIERLKLYPIRPIEFEDFHAHTNVVFTYKVRLTIAEIVIPQIEVVPTGLDVVVLGRDVLNRFNLHLYGPRLVFEIDT
ncbi:MAG: hypothetical protein DYG89_52815 [Caldilinea sp. CFX5]|nr:hypothetical protein [Caldilinea sp. CFX5]